jgi:hypothetical protein
LPALTIVFAAFGTKIFYFFSFFRGTMREEITLKQKDNTFGAIDPDAEPLKTSAYRYLWAKTSGKPRA